jgi:hypothetical protein
LDRDPDPDPLVIGTDSRYRIRNKMSRIPNTAGNIFSDATKLFPVSRKQIKLKDPLPGKDVGGLLAGEVQLAVGQLGLLSLGAHVPEGQTARQPQRPILELIKISSVSPLIHIVKCPK